MTTIAPAESTGFNGSSITRVTTRRRCVGVRTDLDHVELLGTAN